MQAFIRSQPDELALTRERTGLVSFGDALVACRSQHLSRTEEEQERGSESDNTVGGARGDCAHGYCAHTPRARTPHRRGGQMTTGADKIRFLFALCMYEQKPEAGRGAGKPRSSSLRVLANTDNEARVDCTLVRVDVKLTRR